MKDFEQSLLNILSTNSTNRKSGEAFISNLEQQEDFYKYLLYGLSLSPDSATLSSILFRQKYLKSGRISSLPQEQQKEIRNYVISSVSPDRPLPYLKSASIIISDFLQLGRDIEESYSLLINFSGQGLFFLYLTEHLIMNWPEFKTLTREKLSPILWEKGKEKQIEILAFRLLCETCNEEILNTDAFLSRLRDIIQSNLSNPELLSLIDSIISVKFQFPLFLSPILPEIIKTLIQISSSPQCAHDNKVASVEFILRLDVKSLSVELLQDLLVFGFSLLSDLSNFSDLNQWAEDVQDQKAIYNDNINLGKDILVNLLIDSRVHFYYLQLSQAYLTANHWVHQHTAILTLSYYCLNTSNYLELYDSVLAFLQSQNPYLQWASLCALSSFVYTVGSFIKIPANIYEILTAMISSPVLKVQVCAIDTLLLLISSSKNEKFSLKAYEAPVVEQVYLLLCNESLNICVLNNLIRIVAYLSEFCVQEFTKLFNSFVSGLENIARSSINQFTRAEAVRSLAVICTGNENLAACCCGFFSELIGSSDVVDDGILESGPMLFRCLKEKFYPWAGLFIGKTLENARIEVKSGKKNILINFNSDENLNTTLEISSERLSSKQVACKALMDYSMLGKVYEPFIKETLAVVNDLRGFKKSKKIKSYAMKTIRAIESMHENIIVS